MHLEYSHDVKTAIIDYNASFLDRKAVNRIFHQLFIDQLTGRNENQKDELENKIKPSQLLFDEVIALKNELPNQGNELNAPSFYDIPEIKDHADAYEFSSEIEGYFIDAIRRYFLCVLKIHHRPKSIEPDYFDFSFESYFEDESLMESMEVQNTIDWALIGQALAKKEIDRLTKKRGQNKKDSHIDLKRSDFAEGVISCFTEIQVEKSNEGYDYPTDLEVCQIYRLVLADSENEFDELEAHIKLKNITNRAACNSISRGRNIEFE